jgi:hypothetical protein
MLTQQTMKKITYRDKAGRDHQAKVSDSGEFASLLQRVGVSYLIDSKDSCKVNGFKSLEDGAVYTLDDAVTQQQNGELQYVVVVVSCVVVVVVFSVLLKYGNARFLEYENSNDSLSGTRLVESAPPAGVCV